MATMYVPDELVEDVTYLKRLRIQGKAYNIILYCKEENENKERSKENKDKEERPNPNPKEKINKKEFSKCMIPTLEEVKEYHEKIGVSNYTAEDFFDYYEAFGWITKEGRTIRNWKALMRRWVTSREKYEKNTNRKSTHNVTNKNQQRQAAGAGAQAAGAAAREEHRKEDLERHLASHHPGDDRLAKLAREIDEVAQEVGVPTTEYTLQQIAYDAQALLYRMVFCEGWTDEKWQQAMAYVKKHIKEKKLNTDTLIGCVYDFSKVKR